MLHRCAVNNRACRPRVPSMIYRHLSCGEDVVWSVKVPLLQDRIANQPIDTSEPVREWRGGEHVMHASSRVDIVADAAFGIPPSHGSAIPRDVSSVHDAYLYSAKCRAMGILEGRRRSEEHT